MSESFATILRAGPCFDSGAVQVGIRCVKIAGTSPQEGDKDETQ